MKFNRQFRGYLTMHGGDVLVGGTLNWWNLQQINSPEVFSLGLAILRVLRVGLRPEMDFQHYWLKNKYCILMTVVILSDFTVMMLTMAMTVIMLLSDTHLLLSGMNLEWESSSISITGE